MGFLREDEEKKKKGNRKYKDYGKQDHGLLGRLPAKRAAFEQATSGTFWESQAGNMTLVSSSQVTDVSFRLQMTSKEACDKGSCGARESNSSFSDPLLSQGRYRYWLLASTVGLHCRRPNHELAEFRPINRVLTNRSYHSYMHKTCGISSEAIIYIRGDLVSSQPRQFSAAYGVQALGRLRYLGPNRYLPT